MVQCVAHLEQPEAVERSSAPRVSAHKPKPRRGKSKNRPKINLLGRVRFHAHETFFGLNSPTAKKTAQKNPAASKRNRSSFFAHIFSRAQAKMGRP